MATADNGKRSGRRRGHGEGTIYQRPNGLWSAQISMPDGKRKTVYGKTRREVADKLTSALRDKQQGLPVLPPRQTVEQFLIRWLADSAKPSVRPGTYKSYESYCRARILPAIGRITLADLSPQHVQKLLNDLRTAGLAPRSAQYVRAILRKAFNTAIKWGLMARNPATLTEPPRVERKEPPALSPEAARALLSGLQQDRLAPLVTVALLTGCRLGELLGLRWPDVDFDAATLQVRFQLQRIDGVLQLVEPKTKKSRRTIALPPFAITALHDQRSLQLQDRLLAGAEWQETGHVFTTAVGAPLDGPSVTHRFQKALMRAGLPRMRFHDLRHGVASLLLAQGVSARVVMELLGHSQITLTLGTYSHVIPQLQREAADRLQEALGG